MGLSEEGQEATMEDDDEMMQHMVDVAVPFIDDSSDDDDDSSSGKEAPLLLPNHDIRETAILDGFRHAVDSHAKEFIMGNHATAKQIPDHPSHNKKLVTTQHDNPNHTIQSTDDSSSRDRQAAVSSSNEMANENVPNSVPISKHDWKPEKLQLPTWAQPR